MIIKSKTHELINSINEINSVLSQIPKLQQEINQVINILQNNYK